jgi:hypothetical protein
MRGTTLRVSKMQHADGEGNFFFYSMHTSTQWSAVTIYILRFRISKLCSHSVLLGFI